MSIQQKQIAVHNYTENGVNYAAVAVEVSGYTSQEELEEHIATLQNNPSDVYKIAPATEGDTLPDGTVGELNVEAYPLLMWLIIRIILGY